MVESGPQLKTARAGAGNTDEGLTATTYKGVLMAENQSIQAPAPVTIPRALCPTCGRLPARSHVKAIGTIATATFLCERDHGFIVKWVLA